MFLSFNTRIRSLFCFLAFALMTYPVGSGLEAAGWGKTDQVVTYEGAVFKGVYVDAIGLYFTAMIPDYSGASLNDGRVQMEGKIVGDDFYAIMVSMNPAYDPPKTEREFIKAIENANEDSIVKRVDPKKFGAKYVVDLFPKDKKSVDFWRFICTKDRVIQMSAPDGNVQRRTKFFDSVSIR